MQAEGKGFEPSSASSGTALAERPGQPYPATFRFFSFCAKAPSPKAPLTPCPSPATGEGRNARALQCLTVL
jgi:hypothetical protein